MPRFVDLDVAENLPGDAALAGVRWSRDGADLVFDLLLGEAATAQVTCTAVRDVSIQLEYGSYAGPFPSWNHSITFEDGAYVLVLDFRPIGSVQLKCSAVELDVAPRRAG